METERNLQDALHVARNIMLNPKIVPGGGATEIAISQVNFFIYICMCIYVCVLIYEQ